MLVLECDRQPLAHWQVDYRVKVGARQQGQRKMVGSFSETQVVWPGGEWGQCRSRGNYLLQAPLGMGDSRSWLSKAFRNENLRALGHQNQTRLPQGTPHCLGAHCPQKSTETQTPAESFSPLFLLSLSPLPISLSTSSFLFPFPSFSSVLLFSTFTSLIL